MSIAFATEFGCKYTLTGPDGTVGTFNDPDDPNDVGVLSNLSGLDSPEVRESGDVIVEFDGGVQGPNYYGRRPIVLEGLVYGHASKEDRSAKLDRLMRATNAMRAPARLSWTPSVEGGVPVYLDLYRQQPLRIEGAWNKTFQAGMVAADPRIYSEAGHNVISTAPDAGMTLENEGSAETFPAYTLLGPMAGPITISNEGSGTDLVFNTNLTFSQALVIDTNGRTVGLGLRESGSKKNWFPNPSFEGATLGVTATNGTATQQPMPGVSSGWGSNVLRLVPSSTSAVTSVTATNAVPGNISQFDQVTVGWSFLSSLAAGSALVGVVFTWRNSGGTQLSQQTVNSTVGPGTPSATAWKRHVATSGAAPANAARVDITFQILNPHTASQAYFIDGVTVEKLGASDGAYFSALNPLPSHHGVWEGATNNSASWSITTTVNPLMALTPAYATVDFPLTRWAGLAPGDNIIGVDFDPDPLQVGASFRADWRAAWL